MQSINDDSQILQQLYNSQICFSISYGDDLGINWTIYEIGNKNGGMRGKSATEDISIAIWDMGTFACKEFPNSEFAKYFKTLQC